MPWTTVLAIIAMLGFAIYRQSRRHEVVGDVRFKLAIIYAIVGLVVGGYETPENATAWSFLVLSIVVSCVVGVARGRLTHVWIEGGLVFAQGTRVTIGLFLGLVVFKFALGTASYLLDVSDSGGIGEVLLMIAVMVALQAEIVWRRALPLGARKHAESPVPA